MCLGSRNRRPLAMGGGELMATSGSNIPPERYVGIYSRTHSEPVASSSGSGGNGGDGSSLEGGFYVSCVPDPDGSVYFVRHIIKNSAGVLTLSDEEMRTADEGVSVPEMGCILNADGELVLDKINLQIVFGLPDASLFQYDTKNGVNWNGYEATSENGRWTGSYNETGIAPSFNTTLGKQFAQQGHQVFGAWASPGESYYTCATVDAETHTWTGYKWDWDAEKSVWRRAETATAGLTYGIGYNPEPDQHYNANATVHITSLWNYEPGVEGPIPTGYVMYIPFKENAEATTGQNILDSEGTITYEKILGWPCAHFKDGATIRYDLSGLTGYKIYTVSFWFYIDENPEQIQADNKFRCLFDTYNDQNFWSRASMIIDGLIQQGGRQLYWKGSGVLETGYFVRGWNHVVLNAYNAGVEASGSNENGDFWINGIKYSTDNSGGGWCLPSDSWIRVAAHKASEMGNYCADETKSDSKYTTTDAYFGPFVMYDRKLTDDECLQLWASRKPDVPDNPIFWLPGNNRDPWVGTFSSDSWDWFGIAEGMYYGASGRYGVKAWTVTGLTSLTQWTCHARIYPLTRTYNQTFSITIGGNDVYLGGPNRVGFGYTSASSASPWGGAGIIMDGTLRNDTTKCTTDTTQGHYCTMTYDGTLVRSYLDGVLIDELELPGFMFGEDGIWTVPGTTTNGLYADVRIFPEVLTPEQVMNLTKVFNPQLA